MSNRTVRHSRPVPRLSTPVGRGTCPVCGTSRALRRDGTVREHRHDYHRCQGSGWAPLNPVNSRCECGKPTSHPTADPDSAEWGCRVPIGMVDGRLVYAPLPATAATSDPSATTSTTLNAADKLGALTADDESAATL